MDNNIILTIIAMPFRMIMWLFMLSLLTTELVIAIHIFIMKLIHKVVNDCIHFACPSLGDWVHDNMINYP